jgi:hypothetical protein
MIPMHQRLSVSLKSREEAAKVDLKAMVTEVIKRRPKHVAIGWILIN